MPANLDDVYLTQLLETGKLVLGAPLGVADADAQPDLEATAARYADTLGMTIRTEMRDRALHVEAL